MRPARLPSLLLAASVAVLAVGTGVVVAAPHAPTPGPPTSSGPLPAVLVAAPVAAAPLPTAGAAAPTTVLVADRGVDRRARPVRTAATSRAGTPVGTPQQRGERALAALDYPWRSLGFEVVFRAYVGGRLGHADPRTRTLTVYVKPGQDETELRTTVAHELGHALDYVHGSRERRAEYLRLRGIGDRAWFPCAGCDDLSSPAGDWAEVFAASLVGAADFRSRLAGAPTGEQLRRLAPLFRVPPPPPASAPPSPAPSAAPREEPTEREDGLLPLVRRPSRSAGIAAVTASGAVRAEGDRVAHA